ERDAGEEGLHVGERVDRDALAPDLAERARMVGVVAHERGHVEGGREAGLAVLQEVVEALVRLLGGAEARELAHRPQLAAVHRRIDPAGERIDAGVAEVAVVVELDRVRRGERLVLEPGDRREELPLPLRRRVVQLAPPFGDTVELRARVLGRRHLAHCRRRAATRPAVARSLERGTFGRETSAILRPKLRISQACAYAPGARTRAGRN